MTSQTGDNLTVLQLVRLIQPLLQHLPVQDAVSLSCVSADVRLACLSGANDLRLRLCNNHAHERAVQHIAFAIGTIRHPHFFLIFGRSVTAHEDRSTQGIAAILAHPALDEHRFRLTHICLEGLDLSELVPDFVLTACPNLQHLELLDCKLTEPTVGAEPRATPTCTSLQHLTLTGFRTTFDDPSEDTCYLTISLQSQLSALPNLKHISLDCDNCPALLLPSLAVMGSQLTSLEATGHCPCYDERPLFSRLHAWAHSLNHVQNLQLTGLGYLQSPEVQVLLRFPCLAHLTVDSFLLLPEDGHLASKPCTWQTLQFTTCAGGLHLPSLACLPLQSLQSPVRMLAPKEGYLRVLVRVDDEHWHSIRPAMLDRATAITQTQDHQLQTQIRQAVRNVETCGGLRWLNLRHLRFACYDWEEPPELLASALPLLAEAHPQMLSLDWVPLTSGLMEQLHKTFGKSLHTLQVGAACELLRGLRILAGLTSLQRLEVCVNADTKMGVNDLALACCAGATRPVAVHMSLFRNEWAPKTDRRMWALQDALQEFNHGKFVHLTIDAGTAAS